MNNDQPLPPMKPGTSQPKPNKKPTRSYCKKDLLHLYGVTYKTLAAWLRPLASEIGPLHGHYFTTAQLHIIFETLGYPDD